MVALANNDLFLPTYSHYYINLPNPTRLRKKSNSPYKPPRISRD